MKLLSHIILWLTGAFLITFVLSCLAELLVPLVGETAAIIFYISLALIVCCLLAKYLPSVN